MDIAKNRILTLILLSIAILVTAAIVVEGSYLDRTWVNEHLHIFIETVGAFTLILVSLLLFFAKDYLSQQYNPIIPGLLLMGILDIFHGLVEIGQAFVLLHILAALCGAFGFLLFALLSIKELELTVSPTFMLFTVALGVMIGIQCVLFEENLPVMVIDDRFTITAAILSILAGLSFLASMTYFIKLYARSKDNIEIVFILNTALLAVSSLTFNFSEVWCSVWWFWHIVRFIGIVLLIVFMFIVMERTRVRISLQNRDIKEINQKLDNYTYTISHDLKEPIRSIRTFSEFIREDYKEQIDETGQDYLKRIIKASSRMSAMIDDLLIISRIGRNDIEFKEVSLNEVVEHSLEGLEARISEIDVDIEYIDLPVVSCQESWMAVLFTNLIGNCLKYRDESKAKLIINITSSELKDRYEISVQDNGIGIADDQFDKIFGLFRRAYSKSDKPGSGAGLAIVRDIAKQHGGDVYVKESRPGTGTTIGFTLKKDMSNEK